MKQKNLNNSSIKYSLLREILNEIEEEKKLFVSFPFWNNWGNWGNWSNWDNWNNWENWSNWNNGY